MRPSAILLRRAGAQFGLVMGSDMAARCVRGGLPHKQRDPRPSDLEVALVPVSAQGTLNGSLLALRAAASMSFFMGELMAGYSGTPLSKKLGIRPGHRVALVEAPSNFLDVLGVLPEGVRIVGGLRGTKLFDVIIWFVKRRSVLSKRFSSIANRLDPAGGFWVAWPKQASGVATDVNGNVVREALLTSGLVDNKVCAIDETWSGLRGVVRVKDRPGWRVGP